MLLIALWAGCAADPAPQAAVDPTGNWSMTFVWTKGSCGLTGSFDGSITVLRTETGFEINETRPQVVVSGTVLCTAQRCTLSFTETGPGPAGSSVQQISLSANLAVDDIDAITGSGAATYRFTDGTGCEHQFSANGQRH